MISASTTVLLRFISVVVLAALVLASPVAADDDDDDDDDSGARRTGVVENDHPFGAYLHRGTCEQIGETVEDMVDRDDDDDQEDDDRRDDEQIWERISGEDARPDLHRIEDDDVDLSLDELMGAEYVVTIHEGDDAESPVVACGAVTGEIDDRGGLLLDLEEVEDSSYEGRAYLAPDDDDDNDDDDDEIEVFIGIWEVQPTGV